VSTESAVTILVIISRSCYAESRKLRFPPIRFVVHTVESCDSATLRKSVKRNRSTPVSGEVFLVSRSLEFMTCPPRRVSQCSLVNFAEPAAQVIPTHKNTQPSSMEPSPTGARAKSVAGSGVDLNPLTQSGAISRQANCVEATAEPFEAAPSSSSDEEGATQAVVVLRATSDIGSSVNAAAVSGSNIIGSSDSQVLEDSVGALRDFKAQRTLGGLSCGGSTVASTSDFSLLKQSQSAGGLLFRQGSIGEENSSSDDWSTVVKTTGPLVKTTAAGQNAEKGVGEAKSARSFGGSAAWRMDGCEDSTAVFPDGVCPAGSAVCESGGMVGRVGEAVVSDPRSLRRAVSAGVVSTRSDEEYDLRGSSGIRPEAGCDSPFRNEHKARRRSATALSDIDFGTSPVVPLDDAGAAGNSVDRNLEEEPAAGSCCGRAQQPVCIENRTDLYDGEAFPSAEAAPNPSFEAVRRLTESFSEGSSRKARHPLLSGESSGGPLAPGASNSVASVSYPPPRVLRLPVSTPRDDGTPTVSVARQQEPSPAQTSGIRDSDPSPLGAGTHLNPPAVPAVPAVPRSDTDEAGVSREAPVLVHQSSGTAADAAEPDATSRTDATSRCAGWLPRPPSLSPASSSSSLRAEEDVALNLLAAAELYRSLDFADSDVMSRCVRRSQLQMAAQNNRASGCSDGPLCCFGRASGLSTAASACPAGTGGGRNSSGGAALGGAGAVVPEANASGTGRGCLSAPRSGREGRGSFVGAPETSIIVVCTQTFATATLLRRPDKFSARQVAAATTTSEPLPQTAPPQTATTNRQ